jgi:hypothetical protein
VGGGRRAVVPSQLRVKPHNFPARTGAEGVPARAADVYVEQRHAALRDAVRRHGDAKAAPLPLALVENGSRALSDGDGEKLLGSDRPWRPDAFAQARARPPAASGAGRGARGAPAGRGGHARWGRRAGRSRRVWSCVWSAVGAVAFLGRPLSDASRLPDAPLRLCGLLGAAEVVRAAGRR